MDARWVFSGFSRRGRAAPAPPKTLLVLSGLLAGDDAAKIRTPAATVNTVSRVSSRHVSGMDAATANNEAAKKARDFPSRRTPETAHPSINPNSP